MGKFFALLLIFTLLNLAGGLRIIKAANTSMDLTMGAGIGGYMWFIGDFDFTINNNSTTTNSRIVTLTFETDADVKDMRISNSGDFRDAKLQSYQKTTTLELTKGDGKKTLYVKLYNQWGFDSEIVSKSIFLITPASRADINKNNKVDIFDFNILTVNWVSIITGNIADINIDGVVDIFDFNLLMVHWT